MIRPTHCRKARREGRCPLCRGVIAVGERMVKVGRRGTWTHLGCFIRRYLPIKETS